MAGSDPTAVHNLTALLASTASASTVSIPSDDSLVSVLQSRYRNDLFATYLGDTTLVQVNPLRATDDVNDERAEWYAGAYRPGTGGETRQPHLYDLAARVFLTMRRTGKSQGVVYTYVRPGFVKSVPKFSRAIVPAEASLDPESRPRCDS